MATNLSQDPFSTAEEYALKAQGYANLWDNTMAKVYWDLANNLWQYSSYANSTIWAYDNLLDFMSWNENKLQNVAWGLYNSLVNDINSQRTYVNDMFWPNWELTNEVNKYYDNLWNYLATDAWRQAAIIAAQWQHSWASLWAIRAQQNEAYNQSFQRYVQAKEQQINAKQQIASNLINFMSTLRKEYWDTTNQYIIEMYKRAYDLYNNVALSVAQDLDNYNKLRFSNSGSGWSSSANNVSLDSETPDWTSSGWSSIISSKDASSIWATLDNANNRWRNVFSRLLRNFTDTPTWAVDDVANVTKAVATTKDKNKLINVMADAAKNIIKNTAKRVSK